MKKPIPRGSGFLRRSHTSRKPPSIQNRYKDSNRLSVPSDKPVGGR
jgi:hypothetical protein